MAESILQDTSKSRARRLRSAATKKQLYMHEQVVASKNHARAEAMIETVENLTIMLQSCILWCPWHPSHIEGQCWCDESYHGFEGAPTSMPENDVAAVVSAFSDDVADGLLSTHAAGYDGAVIDRNRVDAQVRSTSNPGEHVGKATSSGTSCRHSDEKIYTDTDMGVAQQQMMEVAAQMCREQVSEAVQQLQVQLSEATARHAVLAQGEAEIKALLEDKMNELELVKAASPSRQPEPDESHAEMLNELRVRVDALSDMIDDIDEKVQTTLVDDADWMQLRICELEESVGIVCDSSARSVARSTVDAEENDPDDHPFDIRELQDKMKALAERVSHLAQILGIAESEEESEDDDD